LSARFTRIVLVVGLTLLALSFLSGGSHLSIGPVQPGVYNARFFAATTDILLWIESTDHRNLSLYFADYENGLEALERASVENITCLARLENINSYRGVLRIPAPGWFAVLVTTAANVSDAVGYVMTTSRTAPHVGLTVLGLVMVTTSLVMEHETAERWIRLRTSRA
jgi:hypothetical protein